MNTEDYERALDLQFSIEEIRPGAYVREELDAQTDEYERTRDDERA